MARALATVWLLVIGLAPRIGAAEPARIGLVVAADAAALASDLLAALRMEFPEAVVVAVDEGVPVDPTLAARIRIGRSPQGLRVVVEETGTGLVVEREIGADASGDQMTTAQAAALLARSLLGVALLYEPERAASSPAGLERLARTTTRRAVRALEPPHQAPIVLSVLAAIGSPLRSPSQPRFGGRLGVSARLPRLPIELGLEAALLSDVEVDRGSRAQLRYQGVPFGAWARARVLSRPIELAFGLGATAERSFVEGTVGTEARPVDFADWNVALGAEARVRVALWGVLHAEAGLRGELGLGGQSYRTTGERVLLVRGDSWGADLGLAAAVP